MVPPCALFIDDKRYYPLDQKGLCRRRIGHGRVQA